MCLLTFAIDLFGCEINKTKRNWMKDKAIEPDYAIRDFKALFPGSKVVEMPNAGHYSQEDEPELLINLIKEFMIKNENKLWI